MPNRRHALFMLAGLGVSGCVSSSPSEVSLEGGPEIDARTLARYGAYQDGDRLIPAVRRSYLRPDLVRQEVFFSGEGAPGNIVVDPYNHFLYLVQEGGRAMRYGVAVGDAGRNFSGRATIKRKVEWPNWTPTANMIRREPDIYGPFKGGVDGGLDNPLGARALYMYRGGRDTYYRIHGTSQPWSIGRSVSSGCIRLYNQDIIDLYGRIPLGTSVRVMSREQSIAESGEIAQPMVEDQA